MLKQKLMYTITLAVVIAVPTVLASVPRKPGSSTNEAALYQNLHEIKVAKLKTLDFDTDIQKLSAQEKQHREDLPARITAPMERVMKSGYKPSTPRPHAPNVVKPSQSRRHKAY